LRLCASGILALFNLHTQRSFYEFLQIGIEQQVILGQFAVGKSD
jgi:hypothetical protein